MGKQQGNDFSTSIHFNFCNLRFPVAISMQNSPSELAQSDGSVADGGIVRQQPPSPRRFTFGSVRFSLLPRLCPLEKERPSRKNWAPPFLRSDAARDCRSRISHCRFLACTCFNGGQQTVMYGSITNGDDGKRNGEGERRGQDPKSSSDGPTRACVSRMCHCFPMGLVCAERKLPDVRDLAPRILGLPCI